MSLNKPTFKEPDVPTGNVVPVGIEATAPQGSGDIQTQVNELRLLIERLIATHQHDGGSASRIDLDTNIFGMFEVVDAVPTGEPRDLYDQIKIYTNGSTYRLYWYDYVNDAWRYATGT